MRAPELEAAADESSPLRVAHDVAFFVLEDEGVLLSEGRQELHRLNTAAAFLWCCIAEGQNTEEMVAAFSTAFDVGPVEAARHVAEHLHRWQGQGFLSGVQMRNPTEIDFTTALGRLLTSDWLRREFERRPAELAKLLALREADLDPFLSLDPREIEEQARILAAKASASRGRTRAPLAAGPHRAGPAPREAFAERSYRLLTTTFTVRFSSPAEEAFVHRTLAHLAVAPGAATDSLVEVLETRDGHLVLEDGREVGRCDTLDQLASLIVDQHLARIAIDRHRFLLDVHAGAVFDGKEVILFPASPGSGKSTLVAALIRSGFRYCSDELVLLEDDSLAAWQLPISLTIKPGSFDVLSSYYPELQDLPTHVREEGDTVRYLNPPPEAILSDPHRAHPVGAIIFPSYSPGRPTALRPLGRPEAFARLLEHCVRLPDDLGRRQVGDLVRWMRRVRCFELSMSSLPEAVERVRSLG